MLCPSAWSLFFNIRVTKKHFEVRENSYDHINQNKLAVHSFYWLSLLVQYITELIITWGKKAFKNKFVLLLLMRRLWAVLDVIPGVEHLSCGYWIMRQKFVDHGFNYDCSFFLQSTMQLLNWSSKASKKTVNLCRKFHAKFSV